MHDQSRDIMTAAVAVTATVAVTVAVTATVAVMIITTLLASNLAAVVVAVTALVTLVATLDHLAETQQLGEDVNKHIRLNMKGEAFYLGRPTFFTSFHLCNFS